MNYSDIQHRFANKQEGKFGSLKASSVSYVGRNYFSYSTVFGQWVDISKNVVVIFDGDTSISSSKHKLWKGVFPDDVHVFPLDFGGRGYYGWRNCNLVSSYNFSDKDFKEYHRMQMIDHYVERIYDQLAAINGGKKKGLEKVSFEAWDYIEELCSLYKDTSINKYLRWSAPKKDMNKTQKELIDRQRKLVRMLKDGERNVEVLTDALFGEGTYKNYWDYCARFRKSANKRAKIEALCERLGICSPYERRWSYWRMETGMTADQIRKLTAKERVELHFKALAEKDYKEHENERRNKYNKNWRNAYKWIVGFSPKERWIGYEDEVENNCVDKNTGVVYECSGTHGMFDSFDWSSTIVRFDYDDFRKSEDKDEWIANFYKKCEYAAMLRRAYNIFKRVNAHYEERSHRERQFLDDDYLRENTSESEYEVCKQYIAVQDKHYADEEARRRAAEIERLRREEEERKEREYREQVKQEQIDECLERGEEGCRDLWRKHLMDIHYAERETNYKGDFFMGGNVLLRLNLNKDKVETSKNIRIPVDTCKKMWKIVSKWHENPNSFKAMEIDTKGSGRYTISSYENDILTAGCHKIAYTEMERMYNEIQGL